MNEDKCPGLQGSSSFPGLRCSCVVKLCSPRRLGIIICGVMDQQIGILGDIHDGSMDRTGVPGIYDLSPGSWRSHDLVRPDGYQAVADGNIDGFSSLDPSEKRPGRDSQSNSVLAVEPSRARVFFKNISQ